MSQGRKKTTYNDIKFNKLRDIIRDATNKTKNLEWSNDSELAKAAVWQWIQLDKIFQKLGPFVSGD